jgi:hypothetical protein
MDRLLPRRISIRIMGRATRKLYGKSQGKSQG